MSLRSSYQQTRRASGKALEQADESFTLVHNLRARPLIFALACLGLFGLVAAKALVMRAREQADGSVPGR